MERTIQAGEIPVYRRRVNYIIDVRSPGEFAEDHMPGAVNVPMLTNHQRAEVGTLYKENPFQARKLGAVYALEAIRAFLKGPLMAKAGKCDGFMIYCARGGQRSGSLSLVLSQIGYAVFRLEQGYKTWRSYVLEQLNQPLPNPLYVLHGYTGSQKTRILKALQDRVNVVDLEGCALHRGSLLGDMPQQPQLGQRAFETALCETLAGMDPKYPTLIEGESRKIGRCTVPRAIWNQMLSAQALWLEMPRAARVDFILADYHDLKDTAYLNQRMKRLERYLSRQVAEDLAEDMKAGRWASFVNTLLEHHYDPLYGKSRKKADRVFLEAETFSQAVSEVARHILHPSASGVEP